MTIVVAARADLTHHCRTAVTFAWDEIKLDIILDIIQETASLARAGRPRYVAKVFPPHRCLGVGGRGQGRAFPVATVSIREHVRQEIDGAGQTRSRHRR